MIKSFYFSRVAQIINEFSLFQLIAGQRVRLAFGPSVATKCVWCDGVGVDVTEKALQQEFAQFGKIQDLIIDRSRGHALVYFDQVIISSFNNIRICCITRFYEA